MFSQDEQAIIAQCTPKGSGAIALLRLSGCNAIEIADKIAKINNGKTLASAPTHTIHYGTVLDAKGDPLDQVLFLLMKAPQTFTGQDTIEITCHNNLFIIDAIIQSAIQAGARLAQEGEYSKRAVLNNKLDLLQAEAINELIHANSQHALKQSLAQLQGSFTQRIGQLEKKLVTAIAHTNASFEFIDEEHLEFGKTITSIIKTVLIEIQQLKNSFDQQKQIRQGIRIALIGSVNAGKSSLFNALIGDDRAIVTKQAGTTRDAIEAGFYSEGYYWTLVDTAGLRQTNNLIEKEGIARSYIEAHKADIILLIIDSAHPVSNTEKETYQKIYQKYQNKIIVIHNKNDLPEVTSPFFNDCISSATNNKKAIEHIRTTIHEKIKTLFYSLQSPYLINQRQFRLIIQLEKKLLEMGALLKGNIPYELLAYHLNEALAECAEITGRSVSEQAMDAVFREFCVGK